MSESFTFPSWIPLVREGSRVLVTGASGGIGQSLIGMLGRGQKCTVGAHRFTASAFDATVGNAQLVDIPSSLSSEKECNAVVDAFVEQAGGLDCLVVLSGGMQATRHLTEISEEEWEADVFLNMSVPFFLARRAMQTMESSGRVVLMGTESALHGGGATSFPYGIAKSGIECMVKGLAKDGATRNILVNGIRPGFIRSGSHERWKGLDEEAIAKRVSMIPLQRAGTPDEVAALIIYLLSDWAGFITGQMFAITGGDWL